MPLGYKHLTAQLLAILGLAGSASAQAPGTLPEIHTPPAYDEAWVQQLSAADVKDLEKLAPESIDELKSLEASLSKSSGPLDTRLLLKEGFERIASRNSTLKKEVLMRNIPERALALGGMIEPLARSNFIGKGVLEQEIRLMTESIHLDIAYWTLYLKGAGGNPIPYASFGVTYAALVWSVADGIKDATIEYVLRLEALKLLRWDLYRDQNRSEARQTAALLKLDTFLKRATAEPLPSSADECAEKTRPLVTLYQQTTQELAITVQKTVAEKAPLPPVPPNLLPGQSTDPKCWTLSPMFGSSRLGYSYECISDNIRKELRLPKGTYTKAEADAIITGKDPKIEAQDWESQYRLHPVKSRVKCVLSYGLAPGCPPAR